MLEYVLVNFFLYLLLTHYLTLAIWHWKQNYTISKVLGIETYQISYKRACTVTDTICLSMCGVENLITVAEDIQSP